MAGFKITGGRKFEQIIEDAKQRGSRAVGVGIFDGEYPDGIKVAEVGAIHEFGLRVGQTAAEVAWLRRVVPDLVRDLRRRGKKIARDGLSDGELREIGAAAVRRIKESITEAGLIQTGLLLSSIKSELWDRFAD